jgi:large subunit ribosomal protein L20
MSSAHRAVPAKARRNKVLKKAKGYYGRAKNCYKVAIEKVEKGMQYSYRDRKRRKRDFRKLWIQRINAAVREHGLVYSSFMNGLNKAGIQLDRKVLSELAISEPAGFKVIVDQAKAALAAAEKKAA